MCTICAAYGDSRTTRTARCSRKGLNHPLYSPDLSPSNYFAFPKLKMELEGGPICNHKRHSNICNNETKDYSYYWFFCEQCISWKIAPTSVLQLMVITLRKKIYLQFFVIFLVVFEVQFQNLWDTLCRKKMCLQNRFFGFYSSAMEIFEINIKKQYWASHFLQKRLHSFLSSDAPFPQNWSYTPKIIFRGYFGKYCFFRKNRQMKSI